MKKILFLIVFVMVCVHSKSHAINMCSSFSSSSDSGTISDSGGTGGNYTNNEYCGFLIKPSSSPSSITLSFSQFSVENSYDYLYIYDGSNTSGKFLGSYTGTSLLNTITATSGSFYLLFISDSTAVDAGFNASWTSSNSSISCRNVTDNFSSLSYSNNNGTQNWANSWQEVGELDGVSAGKARVRNDNCSSGYCLRLGTPSEDFPSTYSNRGVTRQADISGASSATLSFNYFTGVTSGSSSVTLAVSNNGGSSWTSLKNYTISSTSFSANPESFDITPYLSANTQIRFLTSGSSSSVSGMYVDDIKIEYCKTEATAATLIASYDFDDDWVTNSSLTDQTGSYHGSPSGSISPVLAGASGSKGDTCYAGSFSGGAIDISGLPVSTSSGAKTSVSFWMYWDGTSNVMPMGWYSHDLWFNDGYFGFNTWGADITGISSSGLSLGWHHVAAVFTNGSVSNNKIFIDGVQQSIALRRGSVFNSNATVQSTLRIGGVTNSTDYHFKGILDNFKIYSGEISQSQVTADMNENNVCSAIPIANWQLDESSWNGTLNEVKDSSNNNYSSSGTAVNGANTDNITPVISGDPGTCGYGELNGSNHRVSIPYNSALNPDNFTVSLWAKVKGNKGQYRSAITSRAVLNSGTIRQGYMLYAASNNYWQFWTGVGAEMGSWDNLQGSQIVNNSWTHIAISFEAVSTNNGIHTGTKKLYINGQLSAQKSADYQPNSASPFHIGAGAGAGNSFFFNGSIDEVRLFDSALSQNQIQTIMSDTHACALSDTTASNFNCVENGANGITGKLFTKTTSQVFGFDVLALRDASTIETDFADGTDHTVTIELVDSSTGGTCSTLSALSPAVTQRLLFTTSDLGRKTSASMNSSTAYRSVKCRVTDATDTGSPAIVGCSTDGFSIRPTGFTLTSNLTFTGSSALPRAKTGENFTLTANTNSGYIGIPKIDTTNNKIQAHVGAIQVGTLTGSFNAAISGVATGTTFTYSEVGALRFAAEGIYDDTFTAIDPDTECSNDFSNTVVSGKVGCKFGNTTTSNYFGRFTPDHFELSETNLENRNNLSCSPASSFTYTGESFETNFKLTAKNSGNVTTQNYRGDFAKLNATVISNFNFAVIDLADAIKPISATELNSSLNLVSSSGTWINGEAAITASLGLARTTTNGPFESFNVGIDPVDSDGIVFSSYDLDTSVPADSNDRNLLGTTKIRFGRLNIDNAHGSELLSLPVNLYTEYFNGTSFVINTTDNCTSISVPQLNFNGGTNPITVGSGSSSASIANVRLISGKADFSLSAPGANNTGFIDITSQTFISSFPWLNYDWDSNGSYDDSPSARASFGLYKGNSKQIYLREVY